MTNGKRDKGRGDGDALVIKAWGSSQRELIPCISKILHTFLSLSVDGRNYQQRRKIGKSKRPGSSTLSGIISFTLWQFRISSLIDGALNRFSLPASK